jgi:ArsR family transcriptional regulator
MSATERKRSAVPEPCCTIDIDGSERDRLVALMKAAGNPVRFEILRFLVTHPGCITGDIVAHLPIAQSTVSQHLKVLREAGWIEGEIEGPAVCYSLSAPAASWFRSVVQRIF